MRFFSWIADAVARRRRNRREASERRQAERALQRRVEEAVSATEPKIRMAKGYRERLAPAVAHALDHCRRVCGAIPGPFDIRAERWGIDPLVTAYFATVEEARSALGTCPELRRFFAARPDPEAFALLTMAPEQKRIFGTAASDRLLQRDVQRVSINFYRHRFTSAGAALEELRQDLQERAFRFLLTCALEAIAALKSREERLDRQHEILEVQWRLQQGWDRGLGPMVDRAAAVEKEEAGRRVLSEIHDELHQVRSRLDEPADYLDHVAQVLLHPERFLNAEASSPRLNQMGIQVRESDPDPGHSIPFARISLGAEGRLLAAVIGRVVRTEVQGTTESFEEEKAGDDD